MVLRGKIKRVIWERKFGFIRAENGRKLFFHRSDLEDINFDTLKEGTNVEFNVVQGPKGPRAIHVKTNNEK